MTTFNESPDSQLKLELFTLQSLCELVDSEISRNIQDMLKRKAYGEYLELTIDPNNYDEPDKFADDYLLVKLLSKSPNLPVGFDRVAEAELSFLESEITCYHNNRRFLSEKPTEEPLVVEKIRRVIQRVLPQINAEVLKEVASGFCHGPGATTGVRGVGSCVVDKYERKIHHTIQLTPYIDSILGPRWSDFLESGEGFSVVEGGRFTTVPKTAKTDRGIMIEPTLNVYVQKGVGRYIRRRLRRFGLDLDHQSDENRRLASQAHSLTTPLSTIDLAGASDSVTLRLVEKLFPSDWFRLLMLCRSPRAMFLHAFRPLQKFSSMGNGFTFELESLIFWAVCKAVVPKGLHDKVAVFGDDIIIPREYGDEVIQTLEYLGFSVNRAKSFLAGNFFESCGTDWFMGVAVRPFFMKGSKPGIPYTVTTANKLRLYAKLRGWGLFCDLRYKPLWEMLKKHSPGKWQKCIVPEYFGNIGFIGDVDEVVCSRPTDGFVEGRFIRTITSRAAKKQFDSFGVLLDKLTQCGSTLSLGSSSLVVRKEINRDDVTGDQTYDDKWASYPLRGRFNGTKPRWTLVVTWSNGLEWLSFGHSKITVSSF